MAIAGKVAITPKGEWNANTAYTKLDLVFYENASYVAIQPSTGVTPTNTAYWMLVVQSAGGADLEAIIDGTTQVGNALTLDGHGAEYFAKETDLANYIAKADKPTGTYTGNGDATTRRIAIGGIGDVVVLTSVNGSAIVTVGGTTINSPSGGVSRLSTDEIKAVNGYLNLATTNSIVNGNGVEVTYRVL